MPVNVDTLLRELNTEYRKAKSTFLVSFNVSPEYFMRTFPEAADCKSVTNANKYRNYGNDLYKMEMFPRALAAYTKSLASSPENSEESTLAYANRSAVLFMLKKYVPCLLDINRALRGNCALRLEEKLHARKERCLAEIMISNNGNGIRGDESDPIDKNNGDDDEWRQVCKFDDPFLPKTSSKVKLCHNQRYGRHMVATEDIEPAEIFSSEEFVSIEIHSTNGLLQNCSHCALGCFALVPCPSCPVMLYCSERCRIRAYNSYHRIECQMWPFFSQQYSSWDMAFRMAVRTLLIGTEQGAKLNHLVDTLPMKNIFAENMHPPVNVPLNNDYTTTLTWYRIFDQTSIEAHIEKVVKTIICLRHLNFFTNTSQSLDQDSLDDKESLAAALLLNHCDWLQKNYFFFTTMAVRPDLRMVGHVFLHSFINHSCCPNTFGIIQKREHVLVATQPIKKGEQIFLRYSHSFENASKAERAQVLSSYFDIPRCYCEACTNNWPTLATILDCGLKFVSNCYKEKELLRDMKNLTAPIFNNGGIQNLQNHEILQIVVNIVKLIHTHTKPPSVMTISSNEMIKLVIARMYDDLDPKERANKKEEYFLKGVENVLDAQYANLPTGPHLNKHLKGMLNIFEKLYINVLQRFSEDRMSSIGYHIGSGVVLK